MATKSLEATTIEDENGVTHDYTALAWDAEAGFAICTEMFALVGPALGDALASMFAAGGGVSLAKAMNASLDPKLVSSAVAQLSAALARPSNAALLQRMFRNVLRDGKPLLENGRFGAAWSAAFSANYGELGEAIVWLVQGNRVADFFVRSFRRAMPKRAATEPTTENTGDSASEP